MSGPRARGLLRWEIACESLSDVVAGNVARVRRERGWSQDELCGRLGVVFGCPVSQAVLSQWERGRVALRVDVMAALAHVLDCPLADLLRTPPGSRLPAVSGRDAVPLRAASTDDLLSELRRRLDVDRGRWRGVTPPAYRRPHGRVRDR